MEEVREQKRLEILDAYLWKQIKNDDNELKISLKGEHHRKQLSSCY